MAVFIDGRGLSTAQMQALTREMNYSESTFVLPPETPGTDARVRIFTPAMEMPMAGHPTVGTAAVLVSQGLARPRDGALVLELNIGPVQVEVEAAPRAGRLPFVWMNHRAPEFGPLRADRAAVANALGLSVEDLVADLPLEVVSTGVPFLFVPLISLEAIGRARSEAGALRSFFAGTESAHVGMFTRLGSGMQSVTGVDFHARMFSPHMAGIVEDPATGSMAAPLGAYAAKYGLLPNRPEVSFTIEQGLEMGRPSQIFVEVGYENGQFHKLRIGGESVLVGEGDIFWEE